MVDALVLSSVTVRRGGRDVLRDASATAGAGLVVVTGGNGSGKSTLFASVCGILPLVRGRVAIDGHDLEREAIHAKRSIGLMPERADAFVRLTGRAWLGFVAGVRGVEIMPTLDFLAPLLATEALDRPMASLSAGQRRKIALAAAICGTPRVLLLDEPGNALDDDGLVALDDVVTRWCAAERAVVCAMHRPGAWAERATRRWRIENGAIVED